jgi:hypothetical protein
MHLLPTYLDTAVAFDCLWDLGLGGIWTMAEVKQNGIADLPSFSNIGNKYIKHPCTLLHRHRTMSCHQSSVSESSCPELPKDRFPSPRGPRSTAATLRELRKRVYNEGLGVAAHRPGFTAQQILGYQPAKRLRRVSPGPPATLNERIDAVKIALEQNNLTTVEFVRKTCAYNYGAERAKEESDFQLSASDAKDAEDVRSWAKEIACQELLREAKHMETQRLLHTGSESVLCRFLKFEIYN